MFEKVWREKKRKKKLSAKYNGSLALATLERATIIITVIIIISVFVNLRSSTVITVTASADAADDN